MLNKDFKIIVSPDGKRTKERNGGSKWKYEHNGNTENLKKKSMINSGTEKDNNWNEIPWRFKEDLSRQNNQQT